MLSQRKAGIKYKNDTKNPILIIITHETQHDSGSIKAYVDDIYITQINGAWENSFGALSISFIVPVNSTYQVTISEESATINMWTELR